MERVLLHMVHFRGKGDYDGESTTCNMIYFSAREKVFQRIRACSKSVLKIKSISS